MAALGAAGGGTGRPRERGSSRWGPPALLGPVWVSAGRRWGEGQCCGAGLGAGGAGRPRAFRAPVPLGVTPRAQAPPHGPGRTAALGGDRGGLFLSLSVGLNGQEKSFAGGNI